MNGFLKGFFSAVVVALLCGATYAFGVVLLADGTAAAPSLAFGRFPTTGLSHVADGGMPGAGFTAGEAVELSIAGNPGVRFGDTAASQPGVTIHGYVGAGNASLCIDSGGTSCDVNTANPLGVLALTPNSIEHWSGGFIGGDLTINASNLILPTTLVLDTLMSNGPVSWTVPSGGFLLSTTGAVQVTGTSFEWNSKFVAVSSDVQTFTANGTFTTPSNCKSVTFYSVGGGGGGGSGRKGAASSARGGGGGGGGGNYAIEEVLCATLGVGSTLAVTVAAAANGGTAVSANSTNGNQGTQGNMTYVGGLGGNTYAVALGGGFGQGGTTAAGSGGALIPGTAWGPGGGGGAGDSAAPGGYYFTGGGGGGGGGGISVGNAIVAGGAGGTNVARVGGTAAAGGATACAAGAAGTAVATNRPAGGFGGGGGAGCTTAGGGGAGGAGGLYGGGGGGGGAGVDSVGNSGAGGAGAGGIVVAVTEF